jgi:hypothetical protein
MKTLILISLIILSLNTKCMSQTQDLIKSFNSFEELIKQKKNEKNQLKILNNFREEFNADERFYIEEYKDYYQITVSHKSSNEYSGGAECYKLDKKTGKSEMIWHEHPMKHG